MISSESFHPESLQLRKYAIDQAVCLKPTDFTSAWTHHLVSLLAVTPGPVLTYAPHSQY